ncbi:hypothetical protein [Oceanobacillus locisalsi]|uniref:Uncharacterized protein n=1 Tax=Oceanobacillus locisalsi TaxID=546107 RepID=A0ABW3NJN5_9BACI
MDTIHVFDKESKNIHRLDDEAIFPSQDGKYVFLQGKSSPLEEGVHHIQRTEDYLEGNEQYESEFELHYDEIADELDIDSVGIESANIVYFNGDYTVLHLEFSAAVTGSAGSTNVIIDFQEDKDNPTYYLVDLGIII